MSQDVFFPAWKLKTRLCSRKRPRTRADANRLGEVGHARAKRGDRAGDDVDLRTGLGCGVQLLDDALVGEGVHLDPDARRLPVLGRVGDRTDLLHEPPAKGEGRDEQLAEALRAAEAGQVVEEVGHVGRDLLVGREQAEVLVEARRERVVVAGAEVDVAPQALRLPADDERHLRVDLQAREPVDDVHSCTLQGARPRDVAVLVEAGLELDEAHALLAVLGTLDQRGDERGVVARPVHRRLHAP